MHLLQKFEKVLDDLRVHNGPDYKSMWTQIREQFIYLSRLQLTPSEYYRCGLARRGMTDRDAMGILTIAASFDSVNTVVNEKAWISICQNKWVFALYCDRFGIPSPTIVGLAHPVYGTTIDGVSMRSADDLRHAFERVGADELALKPIDGMMGQGFFRIKKTADPQRVSALGSGERGEVTSSWDEIMARLTRPVRGITRPYLVQERVRQHKFLETLVPEGASTVRILTLRDAAGTVIVPLAWLRLARIGSATDSYNSSGGLACPVDCDTGTIGPGITKKGRGREAHDVHPDTGVRFAGDRIPEWDEIRRVVIEAHRGVPGLNSLGWDVLLSPSGPVVLEVNHESDAALQGPDRPFLTPTTRAALRSWGIELPETELPQWTWSGFVRGLRSALGN